MRIQQFSDERARHDNPLINIERQAAHVDLVDEVCRGLSRDDAFVDQRENLPNFMRRDARAREHLELIGMQIQCLA
jgi:hypothetical protein